VAAERAADVVKEAVVALGRVWMVVASAILAVAGLGMVTAGGPVAAASAQAPVLVQQGHGSVWECPSNTTTFLVAVNRLILHPGQTLSVSFVAKNLGPTACNYVAPYSGTTPGPTTTALQIGPCGSMGLEIRGRHHRDVWPGVQPFNCPALGFAQLQPNATVDGTGTWAQTLPGGTSRVPVGTYTLVVDGQFSFPLRIAAR
jgi:hypothetical protein